MTDSGPSDGRLGTYRQKNSELPYNRPLARNFLIRCETTKPARSRLQEVRGSLCCQSNKHWIINRLLISIRAMMRGRRCGLIQRSDNSVQHFVFTFFSDELLKLRYNFASS